MFNNIGGKIKILAVVMCIIGIVGSVIGGLIMLSFARYTSQYWYALLVIAGGALVSWISSWFMYGFGELIVQATAIAQNTAPMQRPAAPYAQPQQGNPYAQQGNPYAQQGNPYAQQGNPYAQQGNPYAQQNGNPPTQQ